MLQYLCINKNKNLFSKTKTKMPTLFYEIFNKKIKLNSETIKKFKEEIEKLYNELLEEKNVDNMKVLRNKLERSLKDNKKKKNYKKTKKEFKEIEEIFDKIEDSIEELEKNQEEKKCKLIDVVKEVEKSYRDYDKIPEDKKKKYKKVGIKKSKIDYEKELVMLQVELMKLQKYINSEQKKLLIIFEGRDAAGKGWTIKRFMEHLNPRQAKVVALNKPTEEEQTQWYFQRYVKNLPSGWEMALFDRSWYNRAWVEPVMGFCREEEYKQFIEEVPLFEKMLVDSGIKIVKFYFSVSKEEQARRFKERRTNPLKQYKLSPIDQYSQQLWDKYTLAEYKNLSQTHTKHTPWTIINSDNKKKARINAIKYLLSQFDYPDKIDEKYLELDKEIVLTWKQKAKELESEIDINQNLFD